jgi:predicted RNA-binding protein with PUA domain
MKIGVAGSMQFTERMMDLCSQLESLGHEAFMSKFAPHFVGKSDEEKEKIKLEQKYQHDAIREFWKPMQKADALLVANFDKHGIKNYIGGNAFLEMGFAHVLHQKIYLLNPIPHMPHYESEIIAMRPIVIKGDLSKIS